MSHQGKHRMVEIVRRRHGVDAGRGAVRSLNGVDGTVYRKWAGMMTR